MLHGPKILRVQMEKKRGFVYIFKFDEQTHEITILHKQRTFVHTFTHKTKLHKSLKRYLASVEILFSLEFNESKT